MGSGIQHRSLCLQGKHFSKTACLFFCLFAQESHVAQAGLELTMWPKLILFQGWDYRQAPSFLVLTVLEIKPGALCMLDQPFTNWTTSLTSGLSWMEMNWTNTSVVHVKIRSHVTAGRQPEPPPPMAKKSKWDDFQKTHNPCPRWEALSHCHCFSVKE